MNGRQKMADVVGVLETYFEGLYCADTNTLSQVFHPDARYVNTVEGDYMNYSVREYFEIVDGRTPPAKNGEDRIDRIDSIEFGEGQMVFAKVSIVMMGREYHDFLTLIHDSNDWRIISKVFSYHSTLHQ